MSKRIWEAVLTASFAIFVSLVSQSPEMASWRPPVLLLALIGIVAGVIGCFITHRKVADIRMTNTEVTALDDEIRIALGCKNKGEAAAIQMIQQVYVWLELDAQPTAQLRDSPANAKEPDDEWVLGIQIKPAAKEIPQLFLIVGFSYRMTPRQKPTEKIFHRKWSGVRDGKYEKYLSECTPVEQRLMDAKYRHLVAR